MWFNWSIVLAYQVAAISKRKFVSSVMHPKFAFKIGARESWGLTSILVEICHGLFQFSSVQLDLFHGHRLFAHSQMFDLVHSFEGCDIEGFVCQI